MNKINIYPNSKKLILLAFLSALMMIASSSLIIFNSKFQIKDPLTTGIGGIIGLTMFFTITLVNTYKKSKKAKEYIPLKREVIFIIGVMCFLGIGMICRFNWIYTLIIGLIGFLFFGLCFIYISYRLVKKTPSLIINDEGLIDRATLLGIGQVKWNEVKDVFLYEYMGNKLLAVVPKDVHTILERQNKIKKLFMKNTKLISIPQNSIDTSLEELKRILIEKGQLQETELVR